MIHQENSVVFFLDLVYIIDKWHGNCSVRGVSDTIDSHGIDVHMMMRRAEGLFNFMNINYTYQGKVCKLILLNIPGFVCFVI